MTTDDQITTIAVIGAGLMGHGIAQEFAAAGYAVRLTDTSEALLGAALANIRANLAALAELGRPPAEPVEAIVGRIRPVASLEECVREADLVVEAVTENLDLKRRLFADLDRFAPPRAILASNTSSFMPSQLAGATARPGQVLVAHYFNPPYLVPLVELVRGPETADATIATLERLYRAIGKAPVVIQKERLGFIGNRLQTALLREALSLVEQGVATPEDVDTVMRTSIGRRWAVAGVFEVFDLAGLDTLLAVTNQIQPDLNASPNPSPLIGEHVARGELGAKAGKGFHDWTPESVEAAKQRIRRALVAAADVAAPS